MASRVKWLILAGIVLLALSGCTTAIPAISAYDLQHGWQRSNLLLVKDPGNISPEHAIIAFYLRSNQADLEFRLDLLDMQDPLSNSVYLALDTLPGGTDTLPTGQKTNLKWDVLLVFPASQPPYALWPDGRKRNELAPRIIRDPELNTIILQINKDSIPGDLQHLHVQAFLASPDLQQIFDQTPLVEPGAAEPPPTAPVLFAFWETFPAATPAQALRRWDGAHTGPYGRRHGLSILLQETSTRQIPITLLDLKTPDSLSALELVNETRWLQKLETAGIVTLPLVAYGDTVTSQLSLDASRKTALSMGFHDSSVGYGPFDGNVPSHLKAAYYQAGASEILLNWKGLRLIPLASADQMKALEPDDNGPSLKLKKRLVEAVFSNNGEILSIGGPLPETSLADSSVASLFFEYIATHPWIQPLTESELMALPSKPVADLPLGSCLNLICAASSDPEIAYNSQRASTSLRAANIRVDIRAQLSALPPSEIRDQAWQMYFRLSGQKSWILIPSIQANYIGLVGNLIAASRWAEQPAARSDCSADINWDGLPDCILASKDVFSVIEPDGGRLALLVSRNGLDTEQWIGTNSQFNLDLENPNPGPISAGPLSDPDEIPGAFFDRSQFARAQIQVSPSRIILTDRQENLEKTFIVDGSSMTVHIQTSSSYQTSIPIPLDPSARYQPGWVQSIAYPVLSTSSWNWKPVGKPGIQVTMNGAAFRPRSFLDSSEFMNQAENPDLPYPAGHYTTIPLAVLDLKSQGNLDITFRFSP